MSRLVLTRKVRERIIIGGNIVVEVLELSSTIDGPMVRLGITAPDDVEIWREEIRPEGRGASE